jgi:hypothetical protein
MWGRPWTGCAVRREVSTVAARHTLTREGVAAMSQETRNALWAGRFRESDVLEWLDSKTAA